MQGSLGEWRPAQDPIFLCWALVLTDAELGSVGRLLPVGWELIRWELLFLALPGVRARHGFTSLVGCQPGHQARVCTAPASTPWTFPTMHGTAVVLTQIISHMVPQVWGGLWQVFLVFPLWFFPSCHSLKGRFSPLCQCRTMTYPSRAQGLGSNLQIDPAPSPAEQFVSPTRDSHNGRKCA